MVKSKNPMDWSKDPSFVTITREDPIVKACMLPMVAMWSEDGAPRGLAQGTATMIGPRLALASRHVVEDFYQRVTGDRLPELSAGRHARQFPGHMFLRGVGENGQTVILMIVKTFMSVLSDMALLALVRSDAPDAEETAKVVGLDLLPPAVGDRVYCPGYHKSQIAIGTLEETMRATWTDEFATSTGEVTEVFHQLRDSARMPFPCFETNMQLEGGMSGGPVFSNNGRMCGVAVSSLPPNEDGERHVSYFAALWPLMATMVDLPVEGIAPGTWYPAIELVRRGFIYAPEYEYLDVTSNGEAHVNISLGAYEFRRDEVGNRYYRPANGS